MHTVQPATEPTEERFLQSRLQKRNYTLKVYCLWYPNISGGFTQQQHVEIISVNNSLQIHSSLQCAQSQSRINLNVLFAVPARRTKAVKPLVCAYMGPESAGGTIVVYNVGIFSTLLGILPFPQFQPTNILHLSLPPHHVISYFHSFISCHPSPHSQLETQGPASLKSVITRMSGPPPG